LLSNRLGNVSRYCLTQLEKETSASNWDLLFVDEVKQQLNDEERVIMDLLESLCVQLETVQEVEVGVPINVMLEVHKI
jgi:hypothetical protein